MDAASQNFLRVGGVAVSLHEAIAATEQVPRSALLSYPEVDRRLPRQYPQQAERYRRKLKNRVSRIMMGRPSGHSRHEWCREFTGRGQDRTARV